MINSKSPLRFSLTVASVFALTLTSCSEDKKKSQPSSRPKSSPASSSPPPTYTGAQVRAKLITATEIGSGIREIPVIADVIKGRKAPMCSLTSATPLGENQSAARQFENRAKGKDEIKYVQLVARYPTAKDAESAFNDLKKKAASCPPKQNVKAKKVRENFTSFSHSDTWATSEDSLNDWVHLRGTELQEYSASTTKFNIFHVMYDYVVRGNVLIASLYYERTEPGKPTAPIAKRATEVLTKQLRKFE